MVCRIIARRNDECQHMNVNINEFNCICRYLKMQNITQMRTYAPRLGVNEIEGVYHFYWGWQQYEGVAAVGHGSPTLQRIVQIASTCAIFGQTRAINNRPYKACTSLFSIPNIVIHTQQKVYTIL